MSWSAMVVEINRNFGLFFVQNGSGAHSLWVCIWQLQISQTEAGISSFPLYKPFFLSHIKRQVVRRIDLSFLSVSKSENLALNKTKDKEWMVRIVS